jgi:hypothetical protein
MLYNSQSDRTAARTLLRNAASTSVDATSPNVGDGNATSNSEPASKIAHSMATRFKIEQKFTGKLGEDLTEYISNYMDATNDYNLTNQQKMDFMHHLLDGEAKRFYREEVLSSCTNFAEATAMMQAEFNSLTRQNVVRKHLHKLRLVTIVKKRNCTVTEGLEELREIITKLTPQGPRTHRSEEDKVEYLYKAVVGSSWAKSSL